MSFETPSPPPNPGLSSTLSSRQECTTPPLSIFDLQSDAGHTPHPVLIVSAKSLELQVNCHVNEDSDRQAELFRLREIVKLLHERLVLKDEVIENMKRERSLL